MKNKIIICGKANAYDLIDFSRNEVVAYVGSPYIYQFPLNEGKLFISLKDVPSIEYDYFINFSKNKEVDFTAHVAADKFFDFNLFTTCYFDMETTYTIEKYLNSDSVYETLITGLSYFQTGINPELLSKKAFNFATSSQDLYYDYLLVKQALSEANRFKQAVIGLSYYSFEYDLSLSKNRFRTRLYYPYLGSFHNHPDKEKEVKLYERYERIFEEVFFTRRINETILSVIENTNISYFEGIMSKNLSSNQNENIKAGIEQALMDSNKNYPKTVLENQVIFSDLLSLLKDHHIEPIVVINPVSRYYKEAFPEKMKRDFYKILSVQQKISSFQVLDLFDSEVFSDEDFYDVSHLNQNGATKMTKIVDTHLLKMKQEIR